MLSDSQLAELRALIQAECSKARREGFEQARQGFEQVRGADSAEFNAKAEVPANASSLNSMTLTIGVGTYANAPVLWWGDLINQALATTAVGTSTPAAATYTTVFSAPSWLTGPSGYFSGASGYQLSVAYLYQNAAIFDTLNITSSEDGQNAPVLKSLTITETTASPYGRTTTNILPAQNFTSPTNFSQNQLIIILGTAMTLFHYLTFITAVAAPSGGVTFSLIFNVLAAQHRAMDFKESVTRVRGADNMLSGKSRALLRIAK